MEYVISISRPGKSWNLSEGHGKSWKNNNYAWQNNVLEIEKITDELETGFNFSGNRHKHTFYAL